MSHTPGPWSVPHFATAKDENDCDCTYVLADGMFGAVCSVHIDNGKDICDGGNDCPPAEVAKANARLIAAAPDLLAACEQLVADLDQQGIILLNQSGYPAALAAVAKAKGLAR